MISKTIILTAPNGMHARPAGDLVKLVKSFTGVKITLSTAVKTVNAASMLSVLSLGLKSGAEVVVAAEGPSPAAETEAVDKVAEFISSIKD